MLSPGTQIAGYRIERTLGRGGMGSVYEATQLSLGRVVALKLLDPGLGGGGFQERFRREAQLQARLEHPHIVPVYEAGEAPEGMYISMRLIRGPNLRGLVKEGNLDPARAARLLAQIADALDVAHEAGLLHRDVKPQNILVGDRDHAFLADFGITKADDVTAMTRTGNFVGTLAFAAPEQIQGEAQRASDIYALATVAYECLTGEIPFRGLAEPALIYAQLTQAPEPPTTRNPELPAGVDRVLLRSLAKEPGERHPSASALVAELAEALAGEVVTPTATTEAESPVPGGPRDRRPLLVGSLMALALAGAATGAAVGAGIGDKAPQRTIARLAAGHFALTVDAGKPAPVPDAAVPLRLMEPKAATVSGGTVVLGSTSATGPTLLADPKPQGGVPVQLGELQALRHDYEGMRVYVSPTSDAVATIACVGVDVPTCDGAAATLAVKGTDPQPVLGDAAYAERLRQVLDAIERGLGSRLAALRSAATEKGRAARSRAIADLYRSQAEKLASAPRRANRANTALRRALQTVGNGWAAYAVAAEDGDRAGVDAARKRIAQAERVAGERLKRFEALGYAPS